MKTYQRRYPRYDLAMSDDLRGSIHHVDGHLKLMTMGQGGCAFLVTEISENLVPPQSIRMTFEWTDALDGSPRRFEIDGKIVYIRPHNMSFQFMIGIQFIGLESSAGLNVVLQRLENQAQMGRIERV